MEKQLTAMQQVIKHCEKRMSELTGTNSIENVTRMVFYDVVAHIKADELLELERKQIEDAFNQDLYGGLSGTMKFKDGKEYFEQTFSTQ